MIPNVVIHINNEQPLLADLFALPTAADACLVCTNLRTLNGKRPVFADRSDSLFLFPLVHIRFVELPPDALSTAAALPATTSSHPEPEAPHEAVEELELDEEFLRRIRDV